MLQFNAVSNITSIHKVTCNRFSFQSIKLSVSQTYFGFYISSYNLKALSPHFVGSTLFLWQFRIYINYFICYENFRHTYPTLTRHFLNVVHCSAGISCQSFTTKEFLTELSLNLRNFNLCETSIYWQHILWLTPHFVGLTHLYHLSVYIKKKTVASTTTNIWGRWDLYPSPKTFGGIHLPNPPRRWRLWKKIFFL